MSFPSDELDAFYLVAREKSFSKASKVLSISQSAVSQRVSKLENRLDTQLLIREKNALSLSPFGEELMQYCQVRAQLENALTQKLQTPDKRAGLFGVIRIGSYSSISRSVVLPILKPLLKENPELQLDLQSGELRDLPSLLRSGAVDYVLLDYKLSRKSIRSLFLGEETYVMVKPKEGHCLPRYLDHDLEDSITEKFIEQQSEEKPMNYPRHFLDDIYGILDGVELGLGMAVVSEHLLKGRDNLEVCENYQTLKIPVWLHFNAVEYETPVHKSVCRALESGVPKVLQEN